MTLQAYAKPHAEIFQDWATKAHWSSWDRKPERAELLHHLVTKRLERMEPGYNIGTTSLCDDVLPGLDDVARTYFTQGLAYLRKHGKLDGYFYRGKGNGRTFGNEALFWQNPESDTLRHLA